MTLVLTGVYAHNNLPALAGKSLNLSEVVSQIIWLAVINLLGIEINSNVTTSSAILMGIGIDAEIYFLYRFREEFMKSGKFNRSLIKSFSMIRKAIIFSTMALVIGCWILIPVPLYIGYVGFCMGLILIICFFVSFIIDPFLWGFLRPKFLTKGITDFKE